MDPESPYERGRTKLHTASYEEAVQLIENLDESEITQSDYLGVQAIHTVSSYSTVEHAELLYQKGVNLECVSLHGKTPLHYAAASGNLPVIEWLLKNEVNRDPIEWKTKCTPLLFATIFNQIPAAICLLQAGCDPLVKDISGKSILHYSVQNNQLPLATLLLQTTQISVDDTDQFGCTPLHYAAALGYVDTVRILINFRANLLALDHKGHIPMHLAAAAGHLKVVQHFLSENVPYDYQSPRTGGNTLYYAALSGNIQLVKLLIEKGSDISYRCDGSQIALHSAACGGHLECVKFLVEQGANVTIEDDLGQTPLHKAAKFGHTECVEFLQRKAPHTVKYRDNNGCTPMTLAGLNKHSSSMEILLRKEANSTRWKDRNGLTQLHWAASAGHAEFMRELLNSGIEIDSTDKYGKTALHWAISSGQSEAVRILLEHGASISLQCKDGNTAIHYASYLGNNDSLITLCGERKNIPEIETLNAIQLSPLYLAASAGKSFAVKFLVDRGAVVSFTGPDGNSVLHKAAQSGCSVQAVQLLLDKNADANLANEHHETPLHFAATKDSSIQIVDLLLEFVDDLNAQTVQGNSPLHIAAFYGSVVVAKALLDANADPTLGNQNNITPLMLATQQSHTACISLLSQYAEV